MPILTKILDKPKEKISFAVISDRSELIDKDGFIWTCGGGLITLPCNQSSNMFLKEIENCFINLISNNHYVFEETCMFIMYKNKPELFDIFYANYDTLILKYFSTDGIEKSKIPRYAIVVKQMLF